MLPSVSVVIRSYRRLGPLFELLDAVLHQDYANYEVVVIEQTANLPAEVEQRFAALQAEHPRLRVERRPPLGAVGARNAAWRAARNEVVLFIDDDDVPEGPGQGWIRAHAENYLDPACVGVSGRHVFVRGEDPRAFDTPRNHRTCLRYTLLKIPRARNRHSKRIAGVEILHGTNTSIRREAIERAGGWDEDVSEFVDENSFDFRFERVRAPGEYFVYEPRAAIWRRFDLEGGLDRRSAHIDRVLRLEIDYSHRLVRRYFPGRFYALYPAYLLLACIRAVRYVHDHDTDSRWGSLIARALLRLPATVVRGWAPVAPRAVLA
jgi:glycosyltransferase involved in cell wall biosynthesis